MGYDSWCRRVDDIPYRVSEINNFYAKSKIFFEYSNICQVYVDSNRVVRYTYTWIFTMDFLQIQRLLINLCSRYHFSFFFWILLPIELLPILYNTQLSANQQENRILQRIRVFIFSLFLGSITNKQQTA